MSLEVTEMLEWYVYVGDFNGRRIETHNVFDHIRFMEDCKKNARKNYADKDAFLETLRRDLMYYYWSKCEWEIILQSWPPSDRFNDEKIDVYDQIRLNWGIFSEYVWSHVGELKRRERKKKES